MSKFVYANLEINEENDDGIAATLYFEGAPTKEEVVAAVESVKDKSVVSADTEDEFFQFLECPTEVSERAGLIRVQCHPTC